MDKDADSLDARRSGGGKKVPVAMGAGALAVLLAAAGAWYFLHERDWAFDAPEAVRRQEEAAKSLGVPKELALDLGGGAGMKAILIPAGTFEMGSADGEANRQGDEGPRHKVRLSKAFYLGAHPVTQEQFERVMERNPSSFRGAQNPVDTVSWNDAAEFCRKVSHKTGRAVRLPREAEWEWACRAGSAARFHYGDDDGFTRLDDYAWYSRNSGGATHPVGLKKPNAWGLYDMHGNVWEWCADWYTGAYEKSPSDMPRPTAVDPNGPDVGANRVLRGGAWFFQPQACRSASRDWGTPDYRVPYFGFRVAVDAK